MSASGDVLDCLLPCLAQYLSVDHVRIYLMQEGLLTRDEYEQLLSRRNELRSVQVEWLVSVLRGKGPDSATLLLRALRASLQDEDHPGHRHLVQRLEEELERQGAQEGEGGPSHPLPPDPLLEGYLGLVNRLIDALCQEPHAFDRFMMVLSALGPRPPVSVTNLAQLFQHLHQEGHCGPHNTVLLEKVLSSMNKPHLVGLVQGFSNHRNGRRVKEDGPSEDEQPSAETMKVELACPCSEQALFLCSQKMVDWKRLATPLGLTHPEAMQIEYDSHHHASRKQQLLNFWRRKYGSRATYQVLVDAAMAAGDLSFAEDVKKIAASDTN